MKMLKDRRLDKALTMPAKWSFSWAGYSSPTCGPQKVAASKFTKVKDSFFGNLVNLVVLDTQVPTIEKSHSSPGTSKPSPSEGQSQSHSHGHSQHSRSHGASRSSKSAARQHHQDSGTGSGRGAAIATGDALQQLQQQSPQRLQPSKPRRK